MQDEGSIKQFKQTITADINYNDRDGNFDMKQFIKSVDPEVAHTNQRKARDLMLAYEKQNQEQRALRNMNPLKPRKRFVSESNPRLDKMNKQIHTKMDSLKTLMKDSSEVPQREKKEVKYLNHKKPNQISNEIERMPIQNQMLKLFHFDQMEKVNR